jgi:hypothetical protein
VVRPSRTILANTTCIADKTLRRLRKDDKKYRIRTYMTATKTPTAQSKLVDKTAWLLYEAIDFQVPNVKVITVFKIRYPVTFTSNGGPPRDVVIVGGP